MKYNYVTLMLLSGKLLSNLQNSNFFVLFLLFFFPFLTFGQTPVQKSRIILQNKQAKLIKLQKESYEKSQIQRKEALDAAKKNGWKIKIKSSNGGYSELQRLGPNKEPIYFTTLNTDAA